MEFRVYLRALEPEDYLITSEWRKDEEIQNMVGGPKYFVSKEKERQWVMNTITDNSRMVLGICLKENDKLIGTVNIQDFDWINRSCHVPIQIGDKQYWVAVMHRKRVSLPLSSRLRRGECIESGLWCLRVMRLQ